MLDVTVPCPLQQSISAGRGTAAILSSRSEPRAALRTMYDYVGMCLNMGLLDDTQELFPAPLAIGT